MSVNYRETKFYQLQFYDFLCHYNTPYLCYSILVLYFSNLIQIMC